MRIVDQHPQQALAVRQVPDPFDVLGGHTDMHELGQPTVRRDHPQRGIPGPDEIAGHLRDPPQHHRQAQVEGDHPAGVQQATQPPLSGHHLLGTRDQLLQQLIQLQTRHLHEPQFRVTTTAATATGTPATGGRVTGRGGRAHTGLGYRRIDALLTGSATWHANPRSDQRGVARIHQQKTNRRDPWAAAVAPTAHPVKQRLPHGPIPRKGYAERPQRTCVAASARLTQAGGRRRRGGVNRAEVRRPRR